MKLEDSAEDGNAAEHQLMATSDLADFATCEEPSKEMVEALYQELIRTRSAFFKVKEEHRRELSKRIQHEAALRKSEIRYRTFVEQSAEAIWCFELERPVSLALPEEEQLRQLYHHAYLAECNDVTARMYGYERAADLKGRRLRQLLPALDKQYVESLRAFVKGRYRMTGAETHEYDRHGMLRHFRNSRMGIIENGALRRWWGTQQDVTELIRAQTKRDESERRLLLALSAADMGIWDFNLETGHTRCSMELNRILGFEPAESATSYLRYAPLIISEDRTNVRQSFLKAARGTGDWECVFRIRRPDGEVRWLLARGQFTRGEDGRANHLLGAAMDITARRQAQEEKQAMERKMQDAQKLESLGVVAGGIAHDFNNLLTGIIGNASIGQRTDLAGARLRLREITNIAQSAADLCQQMLAYAGKGRFCVQPVDLSALLRETAALVQVSISKQAQMIFDLPASTPPILADPTQLSQIVINLVMNASEAFGPGGGNICLKTRALTMQRADFRDARTCMDHPEGDYVCLEVSDNGCGMSEETLNRIFDPFFTTKFTGRGLGLAAVLGIVRAHRGALFVSSTPNHGTKFRVLFPQAKGAILPPSAPEVSDLDVPGEGTLFIVDDESMVRNVTVALAEEAGYETIEAWNGLQAVEMFREDSTRYAAAIVDVSMPGMDGLEVFSRFRAIRNDLPIILMSGYSEVEISSRCPDLSRAAFLQKPFSKELLVQKLRTVLPARCA